MVVPMHRARRLMLHLQRMTSTFAVLLALHIANQSILVLGVRDVSEDTGGGGGVERLSGGKVVR